jgi:hypothetical protein
MLQNVRKNVILALQGKNSNVIPNEKGVLEQSNTPFLVLPLNLPSKKERNSKENLSPVR